ncbi:hypothetical protein NGRA_1457 [Nosema granulosis]|uniref:Uncharacterized protein n=1 Tax=Nosema granulosis TaxID=83296 RepID=A0A9P6GZG0_9MICR|nr:hypothetical protein NGRA_1457 [Nosema granulosis]
MNEINEKIIFLVNNGFFKRISIDKKGYGTFILDQEPHSTPNPHLDQARLHKREGDAIVPKDVRAIDFYIKSIFCYIRGYKLDESRIHRNNSIVHWKGLYKYIKEILRMTEMKKFKDFLQICLFAVKFHFLDLEANSLKSTEHLKYFTNEFHSLYLQFNTLEKKIKLEDLERYYFEDVN